MADAHETIAIHLDHHTTNTGLVRLPHDVHDVECQIFSDIMVTPPARLRFVIRDVKRAHLRGMQLFAAFAAVNDGGWDDRVLASDDFPWTGASLSAMNSLGEETPARMVVRALTCTGPVDHPCKVLLYPDEMLVEHMDTCKKDDHEGCTSDALEIPTLTQGGGATEVPICDLNVLAFDATVGHAGGEYVCILRPTIVSPVEDDDACHCGA